MVSLSNWINLTLFLYAIMTTAMIVDSAKKDKSKTEPAAVAANPANMTMDKNAAEAEANATRGSNCRKLILILAKRMMKVLTVCTKEVRAKFPGDQFSDHFQCAIKCFMHKTQMSDENYMLTLESFNVFNKQHIPEKYQHLLGEVLTPCLDAWGPKIDPKDEKCTAYGEILKCLQDQASGRC